MLTAFMGWVKILVTAKFSQGCKANFYHCCFSSYSVLLDSETCPHEIAIFAYSSLLQKIAQMFCTCIAIKIR